MLRSRMLAAAQRRSGRGLYGGNYMPSGGAYFGGYYKLGRNNIVYQAKNPIIDAMSPEAIDYTYGNQYLHDNGDPFARWPSSIGRMNVGERSPRQIAWTNAVQAAMDAEGWVKGAMPPGAWDSFRPRIMARARQSLGIQPKVKSANWALNPNYKRVKQRRIRPAFVGMYKAPAASPGYVIASEEGYIPPSTIGRKRPGDEGYVKEMINVYE